MCTQYVKRFSDLFIRLYYYKRRHDSVTLVLGGVTGLNNNESLYSCWWCIWFIIQSKLGITPQQAVHIVGINNTLQHRYNSGQIC